MRRKTYKDHAKDAAIKKQKELAFFGCPECSFHEWINLGLSLLNPEPFCPNCKAKMKPSQKP